MAPDSRATERAKEIAWDAIAPAYHEGASEGAEDREAYRALDLSHDEQRHDELRGHLAKAHGHLVSARDLRRDGLLADVIDGYDPEDIFDDG
jgi:hypothetical protein